MSASLRSCPPSAHSFKDDITQDYDLLILLDVIFARAKLTYRMRACAPRIVEGGLYLRKARHPLLDPDRAVANDLMLGGTSTPW